MKPYQVLGTMVITGDRYKGSFLSGKNNPLYDIINPTLSYESHRHMPWEYRTPSYCVCMVSAEEDDVCEWHRDVDHAPECGIVLWSSEYPTDIKVGKKRIYSSTNSVVLIDNSKVEHRIPREFIKAVRQGKQTNRHFIRMTMHDEYPTDEQIAQWKVGLAMIAGTHSE